ncbi:MAG: helix-turn-helix transcriptional regulator [Herpetosiphonaceae bacterium]|nr:helix-turn-helix transcriptional regulator [Herpetosiphonaceae bacterium]
MPRLFGAKLNLIRTQAGMTQTALAEHTNLLQSHISHLEAGRKSPTVDLVARLTWIFHVSPDYLLQDSIPLGSPQSVVVPSDWSGEIKLLGSKVRELRILRGWSQAELAQQLELKVQAFVSAIEHQRKLPSVALILRLVEVLDLPLDDLLLDWIKIT